MSRSAPPIRRKKRSSPAGKTKKFRWWLLVQWAKIQVQRFQWWLLVQWTKARIQWSKVLNNPFSRILVTILSFSGARAVWERFIPPKKAGKRPAATLTLWLVGVYTAVYGIAVTRYENMADRIEIRANSVISLMANEKLRPIATGQIAEVQAMETPVKPEYMSPATVWCSFIRGENEPYKLTKEQLRSAVEACKGDLKNCRLVGAELNGFDLTNADLTGADLTDANLTDADLIGADLTGADLANADLTDADLTGANLAGAKLEGATLRGSILKNSKLRNANLIGAFLIEAELTHANFKSARLFRAHFENTHLEGVNFTEADLSNAVFQDITGQNRAKWEQANIYGMKCPQSLLDLALDSDAVQIKEEKYPIDDL